MNNTRTHWGSTNRVECLCDGEIMSVSKDAKGRMFYDVMVTFPNTSRTLLTMVPMSSMFGGIGDNFQARLRGTNDTDKFKPTKDDKDYLAATGDRVIISFLGGHIQRPIIVGYLPHPKETIQFKGAKTDNPAAKLNYLGMEFHVDETGQFQIIHRGAPEVSFTPNGGVSVPGFIPNAAKANPALKYPDVTGITIMEMLDEGVWTVRDSEGQQILIDRTAGDIMITNSGSKSTDDLPMVRGAFGGEYVQLNFNDSLLKVHARGTVEIESDDAIVVKAMGNRDEQIIGNDTLQVSGDKEETLVGALTWTVGGDYKSQFAGLVDWQIAGDKKLTLAGKSDSTITGDISVTGLGKMTTTLSGDMTTQILGKLAETITGDYTQQITGKFSSAALGGVELKEAVGSFTMKAGKIAIKGLSGELLDLIIQLIDAVMQLTVPTAVGPSGPPLNIAVLTQLKLLLTSMKG